MLNLRCRCLCLATAPQPCGEAAGACYPLDRRVRTAKRVSRSAGESVRRVRESGMPSCFCKPPPCVSPWSRDTALGLDTWWNAPCAPVGRYSTPGIGIPGKAHRAPRWVGISRLGLGFLVKRTARSGGLGSGWGAASSTHERLSLGENRARSNPPSPSPNDRSDQLQSKNGCPAAGGISPGHRTVSSGRRT